MRKLTFNKWVFPVYYVWKKCFARGRDILTFAYTINQLAEFMSGVPIFIFLFLFLILFIFVKRIWSCNLKCTYLQNIFYANIKLCSYFKNISPLFAVFDFFMDFKTYEKLSTICRTTESEGAWVYSWFDVTKCFAFMFTKT